MHVLEAHRRLRQPSGASLYTVFFLFAVVGYCSKEIGEFSTVWQIRRQLAAKDAAITSENVSLEQEWDANPIGLLPKKTKVKAIPAAKRETKKPANPCFRGEPVGISYRYGLKKIICGVR